MKYASAMKYGGELVAAEDCTYDSFKELVPLCPNCKEPVFLRTGGQRESVKGKAYQIGPHWCHFKGISAEQVAGCELRVNGYTEKDRAKIAAQARGQRLKLLQRWFWRVWQRNESHLMNIGCPSGDWTIEDTGCDTESIRKLLQFTIKKSRWDLDNQDIMRYKSNPVEIMRCYDDGRGGYAEYDIDFSTQQIKLCIEVLEFLCCKSSQSLLNNVISLTAEAIFWFDRAAAGGTHDGADPDECEVAQSIILQVCVIPWASEFQRLESEANQRKEAA